jgi:hypothetical protein
MEYVGKDKTLIVVEEYDKQVILPLVVKVSKYLNLGHEESPPPLALRNDDYLWEVVTFIKEARLSLVKMELII